MEKERQNNTENLRSIEERKTVSASNETYWIHTDTSQGKDEFTLYVDGERRARAWPDGNAALIYHDPPRPQGQMSIPHSQVIFDAVEQYLGIDKVPFQEGARHSGLDHRANAEKAAQDFHARLPGGKEPQHYVEQARRHLNEVAAEKDGLAKSSDTARTYLADVLYRLERSDGQWTLGARNSLQQANIAFGHNAPSDNEATALDNCQKAVCCFDGKLSDRQLANPTKYFEMSAGPELEYVWIAEVSRDPTPEGLDGGRVQYFNLAKLNDSPHPEAPELSDAEKYEQWVKNLPPSTIPIARYENGEFTFDADDPHAEAIIEDIKSSFLDKNMEWLKDGTNFFDESKKTDFESSKDQAFEKAAKQESDRDHQHDITDDFGKSR